MSAQVVPIQPARLVKSKPLAPFATEIERAVRRGRALNARCFTGSDGWNRAMRWRARLGPGSALVLPAGCSPSDFRWPVLPWGLLIDALELERGEALELARQIGSHGTPLVVAIYKGHESVIVRRADWQGLRTARRAG